MKLDIAHENTNKTIAIIEKRLKKEYEKAVEDVQSKLDKHYQKYEIKDKEWKNRFDKGEVTKAEYKQWRINQMAIGDRWEKLRNRLAEDMSHTNKIARDITEEYRADVFADNFNYTTYDIEKNLSIDTDFTTYNKRAIERLMKDNPSMLPAPGKDTSRRILSQLDVRWNNQQLQSIATQAMLQGKSITEIASDIARTFGEKNRASAIRNARTMMTAAENAGRQYGFERANKIGLDVSQQWVATLDNRTRHSHRLLDGEIRKVGEKFSNGVRYPGDPNGEPQEVYNCRCCLIGAFDYLDNDLSDLSKRHTKNLGNMSYSDWKNSKKSTSKPIPFSKITRKFGLK